MDENTRRLAQFLLSDDARTRRQRQNLALAGYDTSGYQPTFGPSDSSPEQAGPEVGPMRRSPVNPIVAGPDQASFLTSEKDTRPHWETDQRSMLMPLVMSGYNNSVSYGVPSFFGGHAWSTMGDIVKGNAVHPDEIAHSANDAAGAAMLGSMPMGATRRGTSLGSGGGRVAEQQGVRAYHGASSPYEGGVYKPKKSQYNAFFAAETPELANVFARSYGEAPRVYPVDIAPTAKLFDAAANPDDAARLLAAYENNPGLLEKNYLVGKETIKKWLTSADSGLMEDRGVQKWLRKNGYDGWKFTDSAAQPSAGDNRSAVGMLKPGHVFSATTGDLLFANPPTSALAALLLGQEPQE